MGTTTIFDLPYPEGSDDVIEGDDAMQALAERIEVLLTPAYAVAPAASSSLQTGITSATAATFAGLTGTGEFTLESGSTIRYTGPTRWFLVDFEVEALAAGSTNTLTSAALAHDGTTIATSKLAVLIGGGGTSAPTAVLRITTPVLLASGQALQLFVTGNGAGAGFDKKQFRITSMGAPQ